MSASTPERPLSDVLHRAFDLEFTPEHPELAPWHQRTFDTVTLVCTGNLVEVPLEIADRVTLRGLNRPTWERDFFEPGDWRKGPGWGVGPPPA
jgi:hypothetical protein